MCYQKRTSLALFIFSVMLSLTIGVPAKGESKNSVASQVAGQTCPPTATGACPSRQTFDKDVSTADLPQVTKTQKLVDELYVYEDPYNIPEQERAMISEMGGDPVYGTCLYDSFQVIMDDLPKDVVKNGVFYDLGCGTGRLCVQAYFNYPFKKVVGVELSPKRYAYAEVVRGDLAERELLEEGRSLEFRLEDIAATDIKDATVVYMCSTCYPDELMLTMTKKFSKLKKGLYMITLRPLPDHEEHGITMTANYNLPMSWSRGTTPVYIYKLDKKSKKKKKYKGEKVDKKKKEKKPKKEKKSKKK